MKTTGTYLRSTWMMLLLVSTFLFGATIASACGLSSETKQIALFTEANSQVGASTTVVITNNGTASISVHATITGDNANLFSITPAEFTLEAGAKKEITVKFSLLNSTVLRATATLSFGSNGAVCFSIPLVGEKKTTSGGDNYLIADPGSFTFAASDSGKQVCKDIIVVNKGTATAYINSWTMSTDSKDYTLTTSSAIEVLAGATVKLTLCYTQPAVKVEGSKGYITINYSYKKDATEWTKLLIGFGANGTINTGGDNYITVTPMQYVFPATENGKSSCKGFIVKNMGRTTVYIPTWVLLTDSKDFTTDPVTADVKEVAPGASIEVTVCYNSVGNTAKQSGYLVVSYSFTQNPAEYSRVKAYFATSGDQSNTEPCLSAVAKGEWSQAVLLGASADGRSLVLTNKTQGTIVLKSATITGEDAKAFDLKATFSLTLAAGASVEIPFVFTPFAVNGLVKAKYYATVTFELDGSAGNGTVCKAFATAVYGLGLIAHKDGDKDSAGKDIAIKISASEKQTIGLSNTGIEQTYKLLFVNNLDVKVTVKSITMKEGLYYTITATDPATTPFEVEAGGTFTVSVAFKSTDRFVHKDAIVLVIDHAITTTEIGLEGINYVAAGVKNTLPEGVMIGVSPVPSHSDVNVTLGGVRSAQIEVVDLLGNTISSATATSEWKWNGNNAGNGSYIVRISGVSANGVSFVSSKRIILAK